MRKQAVEKLFEIIFEDDELLVINKPAGLVCHPTKNGELSSLIGRTRLHLGNAAQPHLVNRLDRETSGVVVVAKNSEVAGELGKILESRAIEKEYLAIVHGQVREDHGLIDAPLGKDEKQSCRRQRLRPARRRALADGILGRTKIFARGRKIYIVANRPAHRTQTSDPHPPCTLRPRHRRRQTLRR